MAMQRYSFVAALLVCALAYFGNAWLSRLPVVKPATAAATEFSAERAMTILQNLLQEGIPHPVGSAANIRVKERILKWLEAEGIESEVQASWGCSREWNTCAWVENIVAIIPGEADFPYLALMAHYDSVPAAPGAGDDGAGVATVLEVGRMLKREGPFRNPILLLITDSEEGGLLGAEAFFAHHAKKEQVGAILNIEGSGSSGASMLLRTAMGNKFLVDAYGDSANYPEGQSLIREIFKRMPNDTDFSVSERAGIPGIDFAFAAERNHYHSPNDNLRNLDQRTLQHHGENVLPLARMLASTDLGNPEDSSLVYSNVYGLWVSWEEELSLFLVVLSAILLLIATAKSGARAGRLLLGLVSPLVYIGGCSLALFLIFKLIEMINGTTVAWPAHDFSFRVVLFATPAFMGCCIAVFANKYMNQEEALLGLWGFWLALAAGLVLMLPAAANLLILPLVVASVLVFISRWVPETIALPLRIATLVFVVPASLGMVLAMEESQGYRLVATTFFSLGIFFASIAPFVNGLMVRQFIIVSCVLLILGTIGSVSMPLYSQWRPQHINIHFIQDLEKDTAYWRAQSQHPLPEKLRAEHAFTRSLPLYPWSEAVIDNVSEAETVIVDTPDIKVHDGVSGDQGYRVAVSMTSRRGANSLALVLPVTSGLRSYELGNDLFAVNPRPWGVAKGHYLLAFHGIQNKTVDLVLNFESDFESSFEKDGSENSFEKKLPPSGYLMETSNNLPGSAEKLVKARHPLAAPVHGGDEFVLIQKVEF